MFEVDIARRYIKALPQGHWRVKTIQIDYNFAKALDVGLLTWDQLPKYEDSAVLQTTY